MSDNELIARFMGGVSQKVTSYSIHDFPDELPKRILKDLKYHTSWDWLMPVVHKIYALYDEFDFKSIKDENMFLDVLDNPVKYPISDTYRKIVEFIKWHKQFEGVNNN